MTDKYILDAEGKPVPCTDLLEWGRWMETGNRRVAYTEVDGYRVSTVFLGLDHAFSDNRAPVLFETMVFKGASFSEVYAERYSTREEAESGHAAAVAGVKDGSIK